MAEMVYAAVGTALADAGMDRDDIDTIVTASIDLFDGKVASSVSITESVGAVMKEEARISDDGAAALFHAATMILSGRKRNVLVVAHCKNSESDADEITKWTFDPNFQQPLGLNDSQAAALQASVWIAAGGSEEEMDRVAAVRGGVAVDHVRKSPWLVEPLRAAHRAPIVDGSCAVVLTSHDSRPPGWGKCRERTGVRSSRATSHVRVAGLGLCVEPHYLGDRDLVGCPAAKKAAERAFRMAGWKPADVERAEISAPFAHQEILWAAAFGLALDPPPPQSSPVKGKDKEAFRSPLEGEGAGGGGRAVVNPTGGWFAGNPYVVSGLERVICAVESVRLGRAKKALAHGCWGPAGQGQCVVLLEASP
ncbi:MAG: hypothetical protein HYT87_13365 [Nitrospirae bacterium]|nr:hypothetical protein [Nitrospirota bacterium]